MFEYNDHIEEKYLWNFSEVEKLIFRWEHRRAQKEMVAFEAGLSRLIAEDSPAIFANYTPQPTSRLGIKYTFNRLNQNDQQEKELCLNTQDPPSEIKNPYAAQIVWALKSNTHCRYVVLDGVQTRVGLFKTRGFNDEEAIQILDVLSDKKLNRLTFAHYPLLTEKTYAHLADILEKPDNKWHEIILGRISVSLETAQRYAQLHKVSFQRIIPGEKSPFERLFNREYE